MIKKNKVWLTIYSHSQQKRNNTIYFVLLILIFCVEITILPIFLILLKEYSIPYFYGRKRFEFVFFYYTLSVNFTKTNCIVRALTFHANTERSIDVHLVIRHCQIALPAKPTIVKTRLYTEWPCRSVKPTIWRRGFRMRSSRIAWN